MFLLRITQSIITFVLFNVIYDLHSIVCTECFWYNLYFC